MIGRGLLTKLNLRSKGSFFPILAVVLGLCAAWSYFNLDQRVFSFLCENPINRNGNLWLKAFAFLGKAWMLVWLLLVWFLSSGRQKPVMVGLLALIITASMVVPLKFGVGRARPRDVIKTLSTGQEGRDLTNGSSFPSGDAACALAVATVVISFVTWPFACLLLAAGAGIALLRVIVMAHYPSDVLMGAAIGFFAGWLAIQIEHRWLPLERLRFKLGRGVATLAVILIPLSYGLSGGFHKLPVFLETYGVLAIFILLAPQVSKHLKKIESADPERFYRTLNWLRKRRTLVLKIVVPIIIAENILDGVKPHELGFHDISAMGIIGPLLVLTGALIRFWARGHFERGHLFTSGPYALVRHPLYLGSLLVAVGVLFQLNNWLNWVVIMPLFAVFAGAAIIYEEWSLGKKFGEQWESYKAKTPAIIPSLRNLTFREHLPKWRWKTYLNTTEPVITLALLSLPFLIEFIENFVSEHMTGI